MYWPFPRTIFSGSDLKNNWHDFLNLTKVFALVGLKCDKMLQRKNRISIFFYAELHTHPMCLFLSSMVFCLGINSLSVIANIVVLWFFIHFWFSRNIKSITNVIVQHKNNKIKFKKKSLIFKSKLSFWSTCQKRMKWMKCLWTESLLYIFLFASGAERKVEQCSKLCEGAHSERKASRILSVRKRR